MKIDYILSDTTKNATSNTLRIVADVAEKNLFENYVIIVPETKSIIIEKELLSFSTKKSFLNVFVYSFVRLLDRFESIPREKLVSKQTCVLLLRKIILENIDKLVCYKKSAKMIGFAEKIYETIAQFKSSDISPDELRQSLATKKDSLKLKLQDILLIYEEYEKALSNDLFDDCDKLSLVSKFACESEFLKESHVFVVGFDNITPEMQKVLTDITKNSKSMTFSSVYFDDKRKDKHIQRNELYLKFRSIANKVNYPYNPIVFNTSKNHDLQIIKNNLFVNNDRRFNSKGQVKIFKAKSIKDEIDFVANMILRQVETGRRFKDIGVMALNISDTYELFEECFKVYDIPYFINIPRKIDNHFLVKFIELSFELITFHLQKEKVLEFISSPIFGVEDYDLFENFVNETGINYSEFIGEDVFLKLKYHYNFKENFYENDDEEVEKINSGSDDDLNKKRKLEEKIDKISQILVKFQDFYNKFIKITKNSNTISNYILAVNFLLNYFDVKNLVSKISAFQFKIGDLVSGQITDTILEKIDSFNNQVVTFLGDTEISLSEFLMIYKTGFSSIKINLSPLSIDCIIIQENTDGFFGIKDMFLVGAIEGDFPRKITDTGIILDSELEETKMLLGKPVEPKTEDINNRAKFSAYESLLEPSENLFISYSTKSITGKTIVCSKIITDINKLFDEKILFDRYKKTENINFDILETRFVQKINSLQRSGDDKSTINDVNYYYSLLGEKIDERLKSYIEQCFDEKSFKISNANQLYFKNNTTSVSKLQTYFGCPYKFFATYGLNLEENKIAKANVLDVGVIIHRVAELFAQDFDKYSNLNDKDLATAVSDILNRALDERKIIREKNKTLIKLLTDESIKLAKYMIYEQNSSSFKIDKVEYFFSEKNGIKIAISEDKYITIIGKIDRIDKFNDFVRVIDYKTGRIDDNLESIFYGTKIQLAIYLMAIQNYDSKKVAGILYFPIHSNYDEPEKLKHKYKMSGFVLDDPELMMKMDNSVSLDNPKSNILPLIIRYDKETEKITYSKTIKSKYSEEEFKNICDYVSKLSKTAIEEILSGYNEPSPISAKETEIPDTCQNCKLFGFCGLEYSKHKFGRNNSGEIDISSFNFDGGNKNE